MAAVDKLEVNILMVDKLIIASRAGKLVDIVPDCCNNLGFDSANQGFYIDFPITGYLSIGDNWLVSVLVYHSSGNYISLVAIINRLMRMGMSDSEINKRFLDYYVIVGADKWHDCQLNLQLECD
ncbi:hypothetical protein G9A89_006867 [Geosiphon pyriformis]|nr:hypothetical protein G9A89_006867 [Geosiphon pyriformis]